MADLVPASAQAACVFPMWVSPGYLCVFKMPNMCECLPAMGWRPAYCAPCMVPELPAIGFRQATPNGWLQ